MARRTSGVMTEKETTAGVTETDHPDADATPPSSGSQDVKSPTTAPIDDQEEAAEESAAPATLEEKLEAAEKQAHENHERFLRAAAELDNFRKRKEREVSDLRKYANQALLKELLATFQIEAVEHLQALNQALLQLERRPDEAPRQELLRTAFRAAHSLKGAARAVSLTEIEQLSHAMESVLQAARDANLVLTADACDVLYDTLDAIQQILDGKVVGIDSLQTRLAAVGGDVPAQEPDAAAPAPPDSASVPEPDAVPVMSAPTDETIRVAVDKLDNLMAQAGELLVARISSEQRLTDMQELRAELTAWPRTWREIKTLLPHVEGDVGEQLNDLLNGHHARLQVFMREIDNVDRLLNHDASRLGMVATQLQDEVRRVRMVPFQQMVLTLERAVRDAAHSEDKQIALRVTGSDVELDKKVLEQLKDPLLHLLRNAQV